MNKKILLYIVSGLILSSFIYAAPLNLDLALQPLSGIDVARLYIQYGPFIDAVIYLILFLSLAQLVFTKVYADAKKEAKMISVAIALALTFSMVLLEMRTGFNLGQLAPVALIIFLSVIAMLLYNLLLGLFGENGKSSSAALTYLIIYGLLTVPFNELNKWITDNSPMLSSVLAIAAIVAFLYLVIQLFRVLTSGAKGVKDSVNELRGSRDPPVTPPGPGPGPGPGPVAPNTLTITVPTDAGYANGDRINVTFDVSGPGFNGRYDYDIRINGTSPDGRRPRVSGHHITDPIAYTMGVAPSRVGQNTIQVTAYSRGTFGGTNRIIAQAQVVFPIAPGGGGNTFTNLLSDYNDSITNLRTRFQEYAQLFNHLTQMHHDFRAGIAGSRDPNAMEWANLLMLRTNMDAANAMTNAVLNQINNARAAHAVISPTDLTTLVNLMTIDMNINIAIVNYEVAIRNAYNHATAPPVIPTP